MTHLILVCAILLLSCAPVRHAMDVLPVPPIEIAPQLAPKEMR